MSKDWEEKLKTIFEAYPKAQAYQEVINLIRETLAKEKKALLKTIANDSRPFFNADCIRCGKKIHTCHKTKINYCFEHKSTTTERVQKFRKLHPTYDQERRAKLKELEKE